MKAIKIFGNSMVEVDIDGYSEIQRQVCGPVDFEEYETFISKNLIILSKHKQDSEEPVSLVVCNYNGEVTEEIKGIVFIVALENANTNDISGYTTVSMTDEQVQYVKSVMQWGMYYCHFVEEAIQ